MSNTIIKERIKKPSPVFFDARESVSDDTPQTSKRASISSKDAKKIFYVNSKEFRAQLEEYYKTDKMTDELAMNVVKIAEGLSYGHWFINYTASWRDEMVGDAKLKMYTALESKKFKIDSEFNPFSYFNQIAWHAFCNRIKKEKKQHDGLQEYKQMQYEDLMNEPGSQGNIYVRPILEADEYDDCGD